MELKLHNAINLHCLCGNPDGNILNFIPDDAQPEWSRILDGHLQSFDLKSEMPSRYAKACENAAQSDVLKKYFSFITEKRGIIIDLASGPSGYFAPALDILKDDGLFIAADGSRAVLEAHAAMNKENAQFMAACIDLDKPLPFLDDSIDTMCGNLLNNVEGYKNLIAEIYRCLKPGGRFAVIDLFYEKESQTYAYLLERNVVYSSLDYYISFCRNIGFDFLGSELLNTIKGKMDKQDLLPIGYNDTAEMRTLYFEKN